MSKSLIVLLIAIFTFWGLANAASQDINGIIYGKVTDGTTGEALAFASLSIVGTTLGTSTDLDGLYEISLAPGTYTIRASYIGFGDSEREITVADNERIEINFELSAGTQLDEVVVSVQAKGQMAAVRGQLSSNKIVNVISSEKMQELPDANAAESIGRLPGISLQRSSGEANAVIIRGVAPAQNNVTIGGVKMASTNASDRSADLGLIQGEMLSGVEVSKTLACGYGCECYWRYC